MSFIFTSLNKRQPISEEKVLGKVAPRDFVKLVDETSTPGPPAGSLLINTRTGEVKHCPFRASRRGVQWYMIREPRDRWRSMRCAAGTLFDKRQCTCVHRLSDVRPPSKLDDEDILILEDDFARENTDETISQSLGISVSDIDFAPPKSVDDIPFWRRQDLFGPKERDTKDKKKTFNGKSDVTVTFINHNVAKSFEPKESVIIGKDKISDVHKDMFLKDRKESISISKSKTLPLVLDRPLPDRLDISNDLNADGSSDSLVIDVAKITTKKPDKLAVEDRKVPKLIDKIHNASRGFGNMNVPAEVMVKTEGLKMSIQNETIEDSIWEFRDIFYITECPKKPLKELGPQFFLMFIKDLGFVPFSCHGNSFFDDVTCSCKPSTIDTAFDEDPFPGKDCTKRAIPELGPQFFKDYLQNFGFVPYVCHGNSLFNESKCTCV